MQSQLTTIVLALVVGYLGGISSQLFQSRSTPPEQVEAEQGAELFSSVHMQTEVDELILQIAQLGKKTAQLEKQLNEIAHNQSFINENIPTESVKPVDNNSRRSGPVTPNKNNLVSAGVDPGIADDILRRISQQEFRRLELQNLLQRNTSSDTRLYRDELRELNKNKISLRSELGDDLYSRYLVVSGQNNRVKVRAVMADSPAELNGIQQDDVILNYGDRNILDHSDLRTATLEGDIGSFTNVTILRDGARMDLIVPRGTLGVQLEAIILDAAQQQ